MSKEDETIQQWKMKRLIKLLDFSKIVGSVVSIIIPPKQQVSDTVIKLTEE